MCPNVESVVIPIGNQRIFGVIHHATLKENHPAVLFLHGFGSNKSGRFRLAYEIAQSLSERGITALRIDFRGCGDSDGSFLDMTISSQVEDGLAALNWLKERGHQTFGILGRSLGAAIAVKAAANFPIKSLCLFAPVVDNSQWKHFKGGELGGMAIGEKFIEEMSTISIIEDLKNLKETTILHIHAGNDEVLREIHRVHLQKARLFFSQDKMLIIDGSDHSFSSLNSRKILGTETLKWFIKTL